MSRIFAFLHRRNFRGCFTISVIVALVIVHGRKVSVAAVLFWSLLSTAPIVCLGAVERIQFRSARVTAMAAAATAMRPASAAVRATTAARATVVTASLRARYSCAERYNWGAVRSIRHSCRRAMVVVSAVIAAAARTRYSRLVALRWAASY